MLIHRRSRARWTWVDDSGIRMDGLFLNLKHRHWSQLFYLCEGGRRTLLFVIMLTAHSFNISVLTRVTSMSLLLCDWVLVWHSNNVLKFCLCNILVCRLCDCYNGSCLSLCVCVCACVCIQSTEGSDLGVNGSSLEFNPFPSALLKTCHLFNIMNI